MKKKTILTLLCLLALPVMAFAATDEDVTQKANVIYVENTTVSPGANAMMTVRLKTKYSGVSAFQFDLFLPEGVTVNGKESSAIRKSELETNNHNLYSAWMKSGGCRVICYSLNNTYLKSKEGEAAVIDIKVDGNLAPGTYPVILRNVEMARTNGLSSIKLSEVQTTLTVRDGSVPTEIEMVEAEADAGGATYNLLGQKVKKLRRGQIGIRRGKKVIEKEEGQR